jgi:3-hydroxybutyrate dehydrogenase
VALEVAEPGITVNAICPGYAWTPIAETQLDDRVRVHGMPKEKVVSDIMPAPQPTKEFIRIEDVARAALNPADDSAAQVIGTTIAVDGGRTARREIAVPFRTPPDRPKETGR